jgi:hypothetical protein
MVLKEIINHKSDGTAMNIEDRYVISHNGNKVLKKTTKGWKIRVKWNDGSLDWLPLKDLKDSNLVELAEYAVANKILEEPVFKWWVRDVPRTE